jgi:sporulation protein YlmC with PRC-barrel domain
MKRILSSLAVLGLAAPAVFGASLTTFRVCEEKRVLKTSDGADAGHVEYIVVDSDQQRVVSAVVTGGVIGQKFVTVPFSTVRYGSGNEMVLERIDRQRLVSAPVIEERVLTSGTVIEPALIQRSYTHFGVEPTGSVVVGGSEVNRSATSVDRSTTTTETERNRANRPGADANVTAEPGRDAPTTRQGGNRDAQRSGTNAKQSGANATTEPGATTTPGATSTDATGAAATDRKMDKAQEKADRKQDKATDKATDKTQKAEDKADRKQDKADEKADRKSGATTPSDSAPAGTSTPGASSTTPPAPGSSTPGASSTRSGASGEATTGASSEGGTKPAARSGGAASGSGTSGAAAGGKTSGAASGSGTSGSGTSGATSGGATTGSGNTEKTPQ